MSNAITNDYSANIADNSKSSILSAMSTVTNISAKFADKSDIKVKRGRPPSLYRQLARTVFPEAKSQRSIGNAVSLIRVAEAISKTDPVLYEWVTDNRRLTVAYEIGRLPPDAIQPVAQQVHDLGERRASVMVALVRMVRGSLKAERRGA
jgi:hypothetical protein